MKITLDDFRFGAWSSRYCCGLQEIGDFGFRYAEVKPYEEVTVEANELLRIRAALLNMPSTTAVTVDNPEDYPNQRCAGEVLKAVGFTEAHRFVGHGGNPLIMWVYNR